MEQLASEGILTGSVAMPLLPGLCDDDRNLRALTHWTANHGGQFVLAGGLTLTDQQKKFFLRALGENCPDLIPTYQRLYPTGSYSQAQPWRKVGLRVRELCHQAGISDRIPRPIIRGEKRALNKRIVEQLANQCYWMELEKAPSQQIWAYRNAAWAIEDLEQDIGLVYRQMGRRGLEGIENVGTQMVDVVERLLNELSDNPRI
jgi:DNA repair photolyase